MNLVDIVIELLDIRVLLFYTCMSLFDIRLQSVDTCINVFDIYLRVFSSFLGFSLQQSVNVYNLFFLVSLYLLYLYM